MSRAWSSESSAQCFPAKRKRAVNCDDAAFPEVSRRGRREGECVLQFFCAHSTPLREKCSFILGPKLRFARVPDDSERKLGKAPL